MTAEIAILNKSAVAMAADSAGSIGAPPNIKIYNGFNKIFELTSKGTVGIMIYGGSEFMGLPIETVIKLYRKKLGPKTFAKVADYKTDFCRFLENDVPVDERDDAENFRAVASVEIRSIYHRVTKAIIRKIKLDPSSSNDDTVPDALIEEDLKRRIAELKQFPTLPHISGVTLLPEYGKIVREIADEIFQVFPINPANMRRLVTLIGHFLNRCVLSHLKTGFVITGFGDDDRCPSLSYFETDGKINGKLKYLDKPYVDIGRSTTQAEVLGFAQSDMIKSFVNGIDPHIESFFFDQYKGIGQSSARTILDVLKGHIEIPSGVEQIVTDVLEQHMEDMKEAASEFTKQYSERPILEMIRHMPKQEMAALAASLIEITSLKRKVTRVQETVGGAVDVAIISKAEGFVWIKRKHYFPRDLNPRYFSRTFGESEGWRNEEDRDSDEV